MSANMYINKYILEKIYVYNLCIIFKEEVKN